MILFFAGRIKNFVSEMKNYASAVLSWNGRSMSCIRTTQK